MNFVNELTHQVLLFVEGILLYTRKLDVVRRIIHSSLSLQLTPKHSPKKLKQVTSRLANNTIKNRYNEHVKLESVLKKSNFQITYQNQIIKCCRQIEINIVQIL